MRGAHWVNRELPAKVRIIPADAGSTSLWRAYADRQRDHPRGCGEHREADTFFSRVKGSSPRMRGALRGQLSEIRLRRIIPADAGSTWWLTCHGCAGRDHPRGCGEHEALANNQVENRGSSPRMRGARLLLGQRLLGGRIIPADAGSTAS